MALTNQNTNLTPTEITYEALRVLHQKCNFITNIITDYDDRFAKEGAKIGDTITVRKPIKFTSVTGPSLSTTAITEPSTTLTLTTQRHVDFQFNSSELTLTIDNFSNRYIKPAMSQLAADMEADAMNMLKDIPNAVDGVGGAMTVAQILSGKVKLDSFLTPEDEDRFALLNPQAQADILTATSGLFNATDELSKQYKKGKMGLFAAFNFFQNTLIPSLTTGTANSVTGYLINTTATLSGSSLTVDGGNTTFVVGDVITVQGFNACHPESKGDLGFERQFVITEAAPAASNTALQIAPAIVTSGPYQNVIPNTFNNATIKKVGGVSKVQRPSLLFHKSAFAFGTADLMIPKGVDMSARKSFDGISMRLIRDYAISSDTLPCRIDVIYGYKTLREDLACRVFNN